jgi:hypothetical protein
MIASAAELREVLGIVDATDAELALLSMVHQMAEGAVKSYLKYDPEQGTRTEDLPRQAPTGALYGEDILDVNSQHTQALLVPRQQHTKQHLVVTNLPIRQVLSVRRDIDARYGQSVDALNADTEHGQQPGDR